MSAAHTPGNARPARVRGCRAHGNRTRLPLAIAFTSLASLTTLVSAQASAQGLLPTPPIPSEPTAAHHPEKPEHVSLPPCAPADVDGELRLSTGCSGVYGFRGSVVHVNGATAGTGAGVMATTQGEEYVRAGILSARGLHRLSIGGGGAGFEGAAMGSVALGFRAPFGEHHGPVIRAGLVGEVLGNDALYDSRFEAPQLQLGYQYTRGITVFELGATTGIVITGRHRAGDSSTRRMGDDFEVGTYAAMQIPWLRLGASAVRLPTHDAIHTPVSIVDGTICVIAVPFAICGDARASRADAFTAPGAPATEVRSLYAGITLGFTRER